MMSPITRSSMLMTMLVGAMCVPASAQSQAASDSTPVLSASAAPTNAETMSPSPAGAVMAPVGVTSRLSLAPVNIATANLSAGEGVGTTRAMMGAGLAAVVIGLIVGGDVGTLIAVGGAVFALVGLYRYMQ